MAHKEGYNAKGRSTAAEDGVARRKPTPRTGPNAHSVLMTGGDSLQWMTTSKAASRHRLHHLPAGDMAALSARDDRAPHTPSLRQGARARPRWAAADRDGRDCTFS